MARFDMMALLEAEMRMERTSALARIGDKLQAALDQLKQLDGQLDRLPPGAARDAALKKYGEQHKIAEEQRFYLIVQREALGLRDHEIVEEVYPTPPTIRS